MKYLICHLLLYGDQGVQRLVSLGKAKFQMANCVVNLHRKGEGCTHQSSSISRGKELN